MKKYWMKKIPIVILIAGTAIFAFSGVVMLLWNAVLASVLHISTITFFQAMGILLLAKILFGGFRGRRNCGGGGRHWKMHMWKKWAGMSPEQQEQFKSSIQMRHHGVACCIPADAEGLYNCKR